MLYRLVRSVKRSGSTHLQFTQRIPSDVLARAVGLKLSVPLGGGEFQHITISPKAQAVRFSLRTRDPSAAKIRQARAVVYLEEVWRGLRAAEPLSLTHRQATALAGELYHAWAAERTSERTVAVLHTADGWVRDFAQPAEEEAGFRAIVSRLDAGPSPGDLEELVGPIVDRLLLARGIATVSAPSRLTLLDAFALALRDALGNRARNAAGDYSPDPKAGRFPEWQPPVSPAIEAPPARSVSLKALVEDWWAEAQAAGRKPSTYDSYRNTMGRFTAFLGHDDAGRLTPERVLEFKDARLKEVMRSGKTVSAQTVNASDLSGLKTVFGWAVTNRRMATNPAAGITVKVGKKAKLRSKGFTDKEAAAILSKAAAITSPSRWAPTEAAKRWVPWLCCYTGARVGEIAQLRKQDLRQEGSHWVITITPEAGTVKTNEAREVVLHEHVVAQGFPAFVEAAPAGPLFLRPAKDGTVLGPLRGLKNRLAEFARDIVPDPNVAPNHGWRHRFKTVGMEAGIAPRILDAIQGQAPTSVADTYGDVTVKTIADAIARLPRVELGRQDASSPPVVCQAVDDALE